MKDSGGDKMPQVSPLEFIERRVCSMTVGGCSIFMGAYAERMYGRMAQEKTGVQPDENRLREMTARIAEAAKEFRADRENRDSVSISKEGRDWLCSDSVYENMKDVDLLFANMYTDNVRQQEKLQQTNPDDPFWGNTGNQWLVFSQKLYESGFYENMSDQEVQAMENILDRITGGMDGLSSVLYNTGLSFHAHGNAEENSAGEFDFFNETSETLSMDLESSVAALQYFSEKYIGDDKLKEEFRGLIDQYHSHNTEILKNYQSPSEKMQAFTAGVYAGKYQGSALLHRFGQAVAGRSEEERNAGKYLGSVTHTDDEKENFKKESALLFAQLKQGISDWNTVWERLEKTLVDYTSGNSQKESVRSEVINQAASGFDRMQNYWSMLLQNEKKEL